jgi:integrase/recombinase XerD
MDEQLSAFLEFLAHERNYSENTIAAYRNDLGQFRAYFSSEFPNLEHWSDAATDMVASYVKVMRRESYASSSVARKVAAIKSFFHYLFARGMISRDPTADLDSPKVKKRLPQTLSSEDVDRLLEAPRQKENPKSLRDTALLHLLYATGMRVTEAVSLKVDDVDLEGGLVHCAGKDSHERDLPFDEETRSILAKYLANGRPHLVKDKDEAALFLNHRGQQLTRQGLWLIIKAYASQADLSSKVTPHTLRHSFAAHKLHAGSELREVQQLLGHANISTTQIYSQLAEDKNGEEA